MPDRPPTASETAPWQDLSQFPPKPADASYGYLLPSDKGAPATFVPCSLDELAEVVANSQPGLLVASPEHGQLVPPSSVRELWPAIDTREKRRRHAERRDALSNIAIFGTITAGLYFYSGDLPTFVLLFLVFFGLIPLVQNLIGTARRKLKGRATPDFDETASRTLFAYWLGTRSNAATRTCVAVLAVTFALQLVATLPPGGSLFSQLFAVPAASIDAAGLVKPAVRQDGEWWRLLTAAVLHGNLIHIFFNASAFLSIGTVVEALFGRSVLLFTFLASAAAGSLASLALMPDATSVGASGGILGLVGFLLVIALRHRGNLPPDLAKSIVRSVLLIAAIGLVAWRFINNAAHAGGFLAGTAIAVPYAFSQTPLGNDQTSPLTRTLGLTATLVLAATTATALSKIFTS